MPPVLLLMNPGVGAKCTRNVPAMIYTYCILFVIDKIVFPKLLQLEIFTWSVLSCRYVVYYDVLVKFFKALLNFLVPYSYFSKFLKQQ